jgi:hypothetical protein
MDAMMMKLEGDEQLDHDDKRLMSSKHSVLAMATTAVASDAWSFSRGHHQRSHQIDEN